MQHHDHIRKRIQTDEYAFLREREDLSGMIYLAIGGSFAYGTNTETSDIDLRGVAIEPKDCLYGLSAFEQFTAAQTDTVIFGLKKFTQLCLAGNPSALEILGVPDDCIVDLTAGGKLLREHLPCFLSKRVRKSFGEYAYAQLRRLSNALCHDAYTEAEQEQYLCETLQNQMDHFNRTYAPLQDGLRVYIANAEVCFDVNLTAYPVRDFGGIYSEMQNIIRTYGKLNHRNRKKDMPHLYKHAMHLIRLLLTGRDILLGHGVITRRDKEQQLLLDIRGGVYSFDRLFEMIEGFRAEFEQAANDSTLPEEPDADTVVQVLYAIYETNGH